MTTPGSPSPWRPTSNGWRSAGSLGEPDWAAEPALLTAAGRVARAGSHRCILQEWCRQPFSRRPSSSVCGMPACRWGRSMQPHGQPDLPQLASATFLRGGAAPGDRIVPLQHPAHAVLPAVPDGCTNGTHRCWESTTTNCSASWDSRRRRSTRSKRTGSSVARSPGRLTARSRCRTLRAWDSWRRLSTWSRPRGASGSSVGNLRQPPGCRCSRPSFAPTSSSTTR